MKYVYAICYIDQKNFRSINDQLKEHGFKNIKAFIPTVKLVKKTVKGEVIYETVPLLFSYGFIRMPLNVAYDRHKISKIRRSISGIRAFLRSNEPLFKRKKKLRIDNADIWDDFSKLALCPIEEIKRFKRLSKKNKLFSLDNLIQIKKGDYLVLDKYPYMGIEAEVEEVNYIRKTVRLNIYPEFGRMVLDLPLEEVLYSVYQNCDPDRSLVKRGDWNFDKFNKFNDIKKLKR